MSDAQPKGYKLTKFNLIMMDDGDNTTMTDDISPEKGSVLDIRNICSGWRYFESIDVPSLRMEFAILDTKDIISGMTGNELIEIEIESDCSPGLPLSITQRIFKIGAVTKSERAQAYVLFTVSPEMMNNESNKVFKVFRENSGSSHVKSILKDHLKSSGKQYSFEPSKGNFNFISPSWRPFDAISYISDKIVSEETQTAGYTFYENKNGYYFHTLDWHCSDKNPTKENHPVYTYEQANVGDSTDNTYKIESINFPDRANHLEKMRTGAYSNTVIGIKLPALTSGNLPSSSSEDESKSAGSINPPLHMGLNSVFGIAKEAGAILNDQFPYPKIKPKYFEDSNPTRTKIRALPGMKDSKNDKDSTGSAGNMDYDTISASAYSYSRWQLLNAISLDITVPGNVGLYVGMIIECLIPSSSKEENRTVPDPIYSGLYLVTGLEHSYTREGITTFLKLSKDSVQTPN